MADVQYYISKAPDQIEAQIQNARWRAEYDLISLSVHGTLDAPRFAAVWWRKDTQSKLQKFAFGIGCMGLKRSWAEQIVKKMRSYRYHPIQIGAVGDRPQNARFFLVFQYDHVLPESPVRVVFDGRIEPINESAKQLGRLNWVGKLQTNRYMRWACLYGSVADPYVAYIHELQPQTGGAENPPARSRISWNAQPFDNASALDEGLGAYSQAGVRPTLIAPLVNRITVPTDVPTHETPKVYGTNKPYDSHLPKKSDEWERLYEQFEPDKNEYDSKLGSRFFAIWNDEIIGGWYKNYEIGNCSYAFDDVDAEKFEQHHADATRLNRKIIRIMASGSGADTRFTAIWATRHRPEARKWRITKLKPAGGPAQPQDPFGKFDRYMEGFMKDRGIRAAQLAITRGGRLLCARAYRWAEAGFALTPLSMFRVQSVSKVITATVTWQVIDLLAKKGEGSQLGPLTSVAKAAKLAEDLEDIDADPPPGFADLVKVNVTQLLRHTAGMRKQPGKPPIVKAYTKASYPLTEDDYLSYQVNKEPGTLTGSPGDYKYSNLGYFLLQEIVRRHVKDVFKDIPETYERAVRTGILEPLGIKTRPRAGRVQIEERKPGDVVCEDRDPYLRLSEVHEDRRVVFATYGNGVYNAATGSEGWMFSAVDLARFLSVVRPDISSSLFLDDEIRKELFEPLETIDGNRIPTKGGWDWSKASNYLILAKNGRLGGGTAWITHWVPQGSRAEVVGIATCCNRLEENPGTTADFAAYLEEIEADRAWPDWDLFEGVLDAKDG